MKGIAAPASLSTIHCDPTFHASFDQSQSFWSVWMIANEPSRNATVVRLSEKSKPRLKEWICLFLLRLLAQPVG